MYRGNSKTRNRFIQILKTTVPLVLLHDVFNCSRLCSSSAKFNQDHVFYSTLHLPPPLSFSGFLLIQTYPAPPHSSPSSPSPPASSPIPYSWHYHLAAVFLASLSPFSLLFFLSIIHPSIHTAVLLPFVIHPVSLYCRDSSHFRPLSLNWGG